MNRSPFFIFILISILFSLPASAATVSYELKGDRAEFTLSFEKGYSYFETRTVQNEAKQDEIVIFFESSDEIAFEERFYDNPVESAWVVHGEGTKKRLHFKFDGALIEPEVQTGERTMHVIFTFPAVAAGQQQDAPVSAVPGIGAYVRMFVGLFVILAIILVCYWVMRHFFKTNIVTDIPGIGRMLGKVNLEMKKSLVFYELGEIIYILGVTDSGINIVDKITDPVDVNLVKSGFSRRKDFSSYLKFFNKTEVKEDVKDTSDLLEEKLSSLRKK